MVNGILLNSPFLYNCRVKTYPDGRQNIVCFSRAIFNPEKWESYDDWLDNNKENEHYESIRIMTEDGIRVDNLKRAKEKVFDIAFENINLWKYMVTLTLDKKKIDRYNAEIVNKKFDNWLRNSVYRKEINYLLVAEPHKDGAIHFHGLLSDGLKYRSLGKKDKNGRLIYVIDDYPFGAARAVPIDDGTASNCCKYITKYMTKDFIKIFGNMYWAGGKLLTREVKTEYMNVSFNEVEAEPIDVLNGGYQVKYLMKGVSI